MKFLRPILLLISLLPAIAEPQDPFLQQNSGVVEEEPEEYVAERRHVSVTYDWIRLPHMDANQLIRKHLTSTGKGPALYAAVEELMAQKKAQRLDLVHQVIYENLRDKTESVIEKFFPSDFTPPQVADKLLLSGETVQGVVTGATPRSFSYRNLETTVETEVHTAGYGPWISLQIAPEKIEYRGDIVFNPGLAEIRQPVFFNMKIGSVLDLKSGDWQLASLHTPPQPQIDGHPEGAPGFPADRVMLFVRATVPPQKRPLPANAKKPADLEGGTATALLEWIEMDTDAVAALLAKHPGSPDSALLRNSVESMINDGSATLFQTACMAIISGQRGKLDSTTGLPYPSALNPPSAARLYQEQQGVLPSPPPPPLQYHRIPYLLPPIPNDFTIRNLGTSFEIEPVIADDRSNIQLQLNSEIIFLNAWEDVGVPPNTVRQPRFQRLQQYCQLILTPGVPALAGTLDPIMPAGQNLPAARTRKLLLFVTGVL